MAVIITVQGPSGSGKTTLIERVIPRLTARGLKVGVIKHAHDGFALDQRGKDSQRFWESGAQTVLAAGPQELFVRQRAVDSSVSALLDLLPRELDCVLIEGFAKTTGMVDVPVLVQVELSTEGMKLNGRMVASDAALGAVEEAVMGGAMNGADTVTTITIHVLLFAQLKDRFGTDELCVSLPGGSTGADLMRWLAQRHPNVEGLLSVSRLAVNCEYVSLDHILQDGNEAVVIPPVSGG